MTKKEMYNVIATVFETVDREDKDEILTFVAKERAALDAKTEKARKRAAEKRAVADGVKERIEEILGDEPITVADVLDALEDKDMTPAKVVARMKALVSEGEVTKTMVKVEGRKLVGYVKA